METKASGSSEPIIGQTYGPVQLTASPAAIRDYVNATGDAGFYRYAAAMRLATGLSIAPPTFFDRELGFRLVKTKRERTYGLHAKQSFEFRRPIEEGVTYTLSGKLVESYTRNEVGFLQMDAVCCDPKGEPVVLGSFTQAYKFPGNRYKGGERLKPTVNVFLEQNEAQQNAKFPDVGSVVEGPSRVYAQYLLNLYSGPDSGIHTDAKVAQRRGHPDAIVQGLMSTELGCELYRELFGPAWYKGAKVSDKYINNMITGCCLTPIAVVASNKGGEIELRTAVYDEKLELTTVGSVTVKV